MVENKRLLRVLKHELVREVTARVREDIEANTSAAMDSLQQKGRRAVQHLQQQQATQAEQLQNQLAVCAESYSKLEKENALLRNRLEALMKHLTLVFGPPPHIHPQLAPSENPCAQFFPQLEQQIFAELEKPMLAKSPAPPAAAKAESILTGAAEIGRVLKPRNKAECGDVEAFHTPPGSPQTVSTPHGGINTGPTWPAQPMAVVTQPPSTAIGNEASVHTFTLTLRRADQVPLGLDLRSDSDAPYLTVETIRPGGAVEAWNRQCIGETREIRLGDRIIMINGVKEAGSMQEECLSKHLLRMTLLRNANELPSSAFRAESGLRADATEFVPQRSSMHCHS